MTPKARKQQEDVSVLEAEERRKQMLIIGGVIAGVLLVIAALAYLVWQATLPPPGTPVPIQGRDHIQPGQPHDPYNSDPPTSGPHYDTPIAEGFYNEAPADEYLVHSLEHGYVVIWYNCAKITEAECETLKQQIQEAMQSSGLAAVTNTLKLIAVPRPSMEHLLVLTSWGRIDRLDSFDQNRVRRYITLFRETAPENLGQ